MKFDDTITWLDGELYNHGANFNEISSLVRRTTNLTNNSIDIQYWVYDCVLNTSFDKRFQLLKQTILSVLNKNIVLTPTQMVSSQPNNISTLHKEAIQNKYEGVMVRSIDSLYDVGKRSSNLLKLIKILCSLYEQA